MSELPSTSKRPSNARSSGIPRLRRSSSTSSLPRSSQHNSRQSRTSKPTSIVRSNSNLGGTAKNSQTPTPRTPRSTSTDYLSGRGTSTLRSGLSYSAERISKDPRLHKDSRPLQDKQWQRKQQKKVELFFQDYPRGLDILNNGKTLRPLTTKMFVESCDFLFKMLDHRISITTANYTEELPSILKKMGYPATVPKTLLSAVNIPRSWPSVLAILSWLVELIQMNLALNIDEKIFPNADTDVEERLDKLLGEECIKSYLLYVGTSDYVLSTNDDLVSEIANIMGGTDEETAFLEKKLETLKAQLQKEEAEEAAEEAAKKNKLKYYKQNKKVLNQLETDVELLRNEESEILKKTRSFKEKEKHAQEKLGALRNEMTSLKEAVKNQPIGPKKRDSIVEECKELDDIIARKHEVLSYQKDILFTSELKMAAVSKKFNELAVKYTKYVMSNPEYNSLLVPDLRYADPKLMKILSQRYAEMEALVQQKRSKIKDLENRVKNNDITTLNEIIDKCNEELEALNLRITELKLATIAKEQKIKNDVLKIEKEIETIENKIRRTKFTDVSEIEKERNELIQKKMTIQSQYNILCEKAETFFKEVKVVVQEGNAALEKEVSEIVAIFKK